MHKSCLFIFFVLTLLSLDHPICAQEYKGLNRKELRNLLMQQQRTLDSTKTVLKNTLMSTEKEINQLHDEIEEKNSDLSNQKSQFEKNKSTLNAEIAALNETKQTLEAKLKLLNQALEEQKETHEKELKALNNQLLFLQDSIDYWKSEVAMYIDYYNWIAMEEGFSSKVEIKNIDAFADTHPHFDILSSNINWTNLIIDSESGLIVQMGDDSKFFPSRKEIGHVVILTTYVHEYCSGIMNTNYGGCDEVIEKSHYYLRQSDSILPVKLEDCFNDKKNLLLQKINREISILKKENEEYDLPQFQLTLPIKFEDLIFLHFQNESNDEYCFRFGKPSLAGGATEICFTESEIMDYIK